MPQADYRQRFVAIKSMFAEPLCCAASCVRGSIEQRYWNVIKSFTVWIHEKCWGTLVCSIPELLKVERPLRHAWNVSLLKSGLPADADRGEESLAALSQEYDVYVRDPLFWAWLTVIQYLAKMLS